MRKIVTCSFVFPEGLHYAAAGSENCVENRGVLVVWRVLRKIAQQFPLGSYDSSCIRLLHTGDNAQESAFSRPVCANNADLFGVIKSQRNPFEKGPEAIVFADIFERKNIHTRQARYQQIDRVPNEHISRGTSFYVSLRRFVIPFFVISRRMTAIDGGSRLACWE